MQTITLDTTPREYMALKAGWGNLLELKPLWDGKSVWDTTPVQLRVTGQASDMIAFRATADVIKRISDGIK